jgi:hypothetical protein
MGRLDSKLNQTLICMICISFVILSIIAFRFYLLSTQFGKVTNKYPNSHLTPGLIEERDANVLCNRSTKEVRNVPQSEKEAVFKEYNIGYPQPTGAYEVDHFIPLALGGSNDIKNLWPEPATPVPGFHEKDRVEFYLRNQVCKGRMPLEEAQNKIKTDWLAVYKSMGFGAIEDTFIQLEEGNP